MPKCQSHCAKAWPPLFILSYLLWSTCAPVHVHAYLQPWLKKREILDAACLFFLPIWVQPASDKVFTPYVCVNVCMCDSSQSRFTVTGLFKASRYVVFCWVVWLGYVTLLSTGAINKTSQPSGLGSGTDQQATQLQHTHLQFFLPPLYDAGFLRSI